MIIGCWPGRPAAIARISSAGPATFIGSGCAYTHWLSASTSPPDPHLGGHRTAGSQKLKNGRRFCAALPSP